MKIQLKRSDALRDGLAKQPTPEQMEYGELAVNFNTLDPSIFIKDSTNAIIKIAGSDAFGSASTLQEVTDEGNFTTNNIELGGAPTANAGTPNVQLDASGNIDIIGSYTGSAFTGTGQGKFGSLVTGGTLEVGQTSDPQSALIYGTLQVTDTSSLAGITCSEAATFAKTVGITGALTADGGATASTLTVNGGATLGNDSVDGSGKVDVLGALNVTQGQLNVVKSANVDGDLTVGGATNTQYVNATGNIYTDGGVTCTNVSASGTIGLATTIYNLSALTELPA